MKYYLAVDIGASSGRHIVGWRENGELKTEEVYRFPNGVKREEGHLTWDIAALFEHVKTGLCKAFAKYSRIESMAIDTWGVDYVLMDGEREILPCYSYRDSRTEGAIEAVHAIMPFESLYRKTGIQFQPFNTIYQLYDDLKRGRLQRASGFLMIPEYLSYRLTGVFAHEYTNATTTGLLNGAGKYDEEILTRLGFPSSLFTPPLQPKTNLGKLKAEIAAAVGGNLDVVLCASHDTASAVEGIPMEEGEPYLSSGTWSLLGVKTPAMIADENSRKANYSNEGGVGYIRYQKNIMGMWMINNLRKELCPAKSVIQCEMEARESAFSVPVDVSDPRFLSPASMKEAFDGYFAKKEARPVRDCDYFKSAFLGLAEGYRTALEELERNLKRTFRKLYIVGGGAKNIYLNELAQAICRKEIVALPIEATALGNLKIQMER